MHPKTVEPADPTLTGAPRNDQIGQLEQRLAQCQARLEQMEGVFNQVADAIFVAALDGRIVDANPEASALLGYSRAELLTMYPWDFVVNTSPAAILNLIEQIQPGRATTVQRIYRCKTGEEKVIDLRMTGGTLAGCNRIIVACRDVTAQQQLEERLRRSEQNLAEGQRLTKTGSWILDFKTGNTDWSVATCRIFGFPDPPPSPHYREFRARVCPEDREAVDRGLRESFEQGEPRPLHYLFLLPDGEKKYIETISQPMRNEAGAVVKLMGTVMDVTERKRAEDALRASEQCARGQAEALTRALDALATESSAEGIVEQVLRIITRQLEAHSSSVWLKDESSGLMMFEFALEDGRFKTKPNAFLTAGGCARVADAAWPWGEAFRTGRPHVLDDIRHGPDFPGRAEALARGLISELVVPMLITGQVEGVLGIWFTQRRTCRKEELELAQALAHQAMLAVQLSRLMAQSRRSAVVAERHRLARDMHDTLAQGFTGVIMQLEAAKGAIGQTDTAAALAHVHRASDLARTSLGEARRSVQAMRASSLVDGTLCTALDELLKRLPNGTDLQADFILAGVPRALPPEWEEGLLRIAQESLTNTLKYARAGRFRAKLTFEPHHLQLQLTDDGRGFNPQTEHEGFGLMGMRERVEQMAGEFVLRSEPGQGTEIVITLRQPTVHENQA